MSKSDHTSPTLARLSFWVPSEWLDDFASVYKRHLAPLLEKHDLVEFAEPARQGVSGVSSRLFGLGTPAELERKRLELRRDPAWRKGLQNAGIEPESTDGAGGAPWCLSIYRTPAVPGKTVEIGPGFWRGSWQSFGARDGFPISHINSLLEDHRGHLWIASDIGARRFDGSRITAFTTAGGLVSDHLFHMLEDRQGRIWFASEEGVSCYDGDVVETFTTADGLGRDWVIHLFEDSEGNLWFATQGGGVSRYDGTVFKTFTTADGLAQDFVSSVAQDRDGFLWFGYGAGHVDESTIGQIGAGGASRYDGTTFTTFTTADGLAHDAVFSIVKDRRQDLWFCTHGGGISQYDGTQFQNYTRQDGLVSDRTVSALEDSEGHLWFSTWQGGVSRYDGSGFTNFTGSGGLASNHVNRMLEDRHGHLWFGTWHGLRRLDSRHNAVFTEEDGLSGNEVEVITEDRRGRLWFGTWNGVARFEDGRFTRIPELDGINVYAILEDRHGHLWFGTMDRGMIGFDGTDFTPLSLDHPLAAYSVYTIMEDREGALWFGIFGTGVARYDGERVEIFTTADGLTHGVVLHILEDRSGQLWFATQGGVSRFDKGRFETFATADGLIDRDVFQILEDRRGRLWFATRGGVSCYDGERFVRFGVEDGLVHDHVQTILEDCEGRLWFGTCGGGVSRYDGTAFQHLDRQGGLVHDVVRQIHQDRDGYIWIGTQGGVNRYLPRCTAPDVELTGVDADRRYDPAASITLVASQKLVVFSFRGRSWTTASDQLAYAYRLDDRDADWQTTRRRQVEYQDLPIGEYCFEVKAVDRDLNYSEPATIHLTIEPDPYRQALTQALSGSSAAGEFIGSSRALRQVQEELRQVAATDLTVLILGETGTGKGLAARTLHQFSACKDGPFVQVNCGALPDSLVESELFGHEKGAFTGAHARKLGKVELAREGTLLLDEIGDMPLDAQVKLLRLLEEGMFERVGGERTLSAEMRVVAATNRDLQQMVQEGTFREDLYFRLAVFPVRLPPLRERKEDIPLLALYFMERMAAHLNKPVNRLDKGAVSALQRYGWPGNVRELEHVLQRAVIICQGSTIHAGEIALEFGTRQPVDEVVPLEEFERRYIHQVLERTGWVVSGAQGAAAQLGVNASTLRGRMRKLGIERE